MIRLFKSLLRHEPLPAHVHYHLDDHGNEMWCDESACRPTRPALHPLLPPRW